jgi:hypothetical protein
VWISSQPSSQKRDEELRIESFDPSVKLSSTMSVCLKSHFNSSEFVRIRQVMHFEAHFYCLSFDPQASENGRFAGLGVRFRSIHLDLPLGSGVQRRRVFEDRQRHYMTGAQLTFSK